MTQNESFPSVMEYLFVARHGSCNLDRHLSDKGHEQIKDLGDSIRMMTGGECLTQILSSSAPRARESADTLASTLRIKNVEAFDYLWSGRDSPWAAPYGDMNAVHFLVSQRRYLARALVLVTHTEVASEYPAHFTRQEFGRTLRFDEILTGEAYFLDLPLKEWKRLPLGILVNNV